MDMCVYSITDVVWYGLSSIQVNPHVHTTFAWILVYVILSTSSTIQTHDICTMYIHK